MSTIVVGVDGSKHGEAALEFAAHEAALRKVPLLVIYAWEHPMPMLIAPGSSAETESDERFLAEGKGLVDGAIARVAELEPQVTCEGRVLEGHPASVLMAQSGGAGMLVVGARGRGAFDRLMLGSVSHKLVVHAPCPLVVVR